MGGEGKVSGEEGEEEKGYGKVGERFRGMGKGMKCEYGKENG